MLYPLSYRPVGGEFLPAILPHGRGSYKRER